MTQLERLVANSTSIIESLVTFSSPVPQNVSFTWINEDDTTTEVAYPNIVKYQDILKKKFQNLKEEVLAEVSPEVIKTLQQNIERIDGLLNDHEGRITTLENVVEQAGSDNNSYIHIFKKDLRINNGSAVRLFTTNTYNIKKDKDIRIHLSVPYRNDTTNWGGLYLNINACVNGTWVNLGNYGYDNMFYSAKVINVVELWKYLPFIEVFNIHDNYTVQFEVYARTYNDTAYINGSHDLNSVSNGLGVRGTPPEWASSQNYTRLVVEEISRIKSITYQTS